MNRYRAARTFALCLAAALSVSACGNDGNATPRAQGGGMGGGPGGGPGGGGARVMPVTVGKVERGSIARTAAVSGVVEPIRTVGVNSQLPGALLQVLVQEGDVVRVGTPLARLDDRELAAQLAAAEAAYQVAEAAYQRAEQLRDRKVITVPEYERDRTAFAAAKAQYDQLRTRIGYATVRAPVSGVITEKHVETGDVIGNQARLFSIADVSSLVVRVGVSELDVVELRNGDPVFISLDAYPNRELAGRIRRIFPSGDPTTRLVPVEVAIDPASAGMVRPGFLARITFALSTHDNVLLIPQSAIIGAQGNEAVFAVEDGKAIRRTVETGLTSRGMVEVRNGLQEGEEIVFVGANSLRDGMGVRAIAPGSEAPSAGTEPGPGNTTSAASPAAGAPPAARAAGAPQRTQGGTP